jgi:hypothetical protein
MRFYVQQKVRILIQKKLNTTNNLWHGYIMQNIITKLSPITVEHETCGQNRLPEGNQNLP